MDRLGLNGADFAAYQATLLRPHDFSSTAEVLDMNGGLIRPMRLLDGQVNMDAAGDAILSLSATLLDDDGVLGGLALNRQVRITYSVTVPTLGRAVPYQMFVGPIVTPPSRSGDEVSVECQDRGAIAMRGVPPKTYPPGRVIDTIAQILREKCGQQTFDFPTSGVKFNERHDDPVTVGWEDEIRPLVQCRELAQTIDMQLLFPGNGRAWLRDYPEDSVMDLTPFFVRRQPDEAPGEIVNRWKVIGKTPKTMTAVVTLPPEHEASPESLAVGGVPQYLNPAEETNAKLNTKAKATARADRLRDAYMDSLVVGRNIDISPVPHLHPLDVVTMSPDRRRLRKWSFPLKASGEMAIGYTTPFGRSA